MKRKNVQNERISVVKNEKPGLTEIKNKVMILNLVPGTKGSDILNKKPKKNPIQKQKLMGVFDARELEPILTRFKNVKNAPMEKQQRVIIVTIAKGLASINPPERWFVIDAVERVCDQPPL